jgi:very-short-patch-repair endonuclease
MSRDGIPVTSAARTLLDLASVLSYTSLRRAVREAMGQQRVAIRQLVEILARLGPRRGSRNFARIIADGHVPTATVLEDIVLDLILAGGFEHPDVNKPLVIDGRRTVPDFRWPAQRIIVEADGRQWHDHKLAREDDTERQAFLESHGERLIRVTWHQAVTKQPQFHRRLEAAGAPLLSRLAT